MGRIRGQLVHKINSVRAKSHFQNVLVTSQPRETDLETKRLVQENELGINDMKCYAQLILDCTKLVPDILPDKRDFLLKTESHARLLCYKLHFKRLYLHKTHQRRWLSIPPAHYLYYQADFK